MTLPRLLIVIADSCCNPTGHVVGEPQRAGSFCTLGVDMKPARWRSAVSRFKPKVADSCADDTRASLWKNLVAFRERIIAASATMAPAPSATISSMSVKPRLACRRASSRVNLASGVVVLDGGGHVNG